MAFSIESPDLKRLAAGAKVYPRPLRTAMAKNLRVIGAESAKASKTKIKGMPSRGGGSYAQGGGVQRAFRLSKGAGSLRADIASAIKVSATVNSAAGAQVRIYVAMTGALREHRRFRPAQLMDKGPFRHRIYGTDVWRDQAGFPYLRSVVAERAAAERALMGHAPIEAARVSLPNVR